MTDAARGQEARPPKASTFRLRAARGAFPTGALLASVGATLALLVAWLQLDRFGIPLCLFKAVTGLPCLSCGSTRVLGRLARLDVAGAVAMNPLFALGVGLVAAWALADLLLMLRGRALALELSPRAQKVVQLGAIAAALLNWAYLVGVGR